MHTAPRATSTELKANGLNAFLALGRAAGQQTADALDQSPGITLFVPQDSALSAIVQQLPREHLQWLIRAVSKYKEKKYRANSIIKKLRDEGEGQQQGQQDQQQQQGRRRGRGQQRDAEAGEGQQFGPQPADSQRYRQPRSRARGRRSEFTISGGGDGQPRAFSPAGARWASSSPSRGLRLQGGGQDVDVESDSYEQQQSRSAEEGGQFEDVDQSGDRESGSASESGGRGVSRPDRSGSELLEAEGAVDQQRAGELAQALTQLRGQPSFDLAQWCQQNGIAVQQQPDQQQPGGGGQQSGLTPDLLVKLVQAHTFSGIIHVSHRRAGGGGRTGGRAQSGALHLAAFFLEQPRNRSRRVYAAD